MRDRGVVFRGFLVVESGAERRPPPVVGGAERRPPPEGGAERRPLVFYNLCVDVFFYQEIKLIYRTSRAILEKSRNPGKLLTNQEIKRSY